MGGIGSIPLFLLLHSTYYYTATSLRIRALCRLYTRRQCSRGNCGLLLASTTWKAALTSYSQQPQPASQSESNAAREYKLRDELNT